MIYLIIFKNSAAYTKWYDYENHYTRGMIVINLATDKITFDGINWHDIQEDHL